MKTTKLIIGTGTLLVLASVLTLVKGEDGGHENASVEEMGKKSGHIPRIFDYESYVSKYRKSYNPVETLNKARLFFGRTLQIFRHNVLYKSGQSGYYLAQNEFTDLSSDEVQRQFSKENFEDMQPVAEALADPDAPADSFLESGGDEKLNEEQFPKSPRYDQGPESAVNFLGDQSVENPRKILQEIKTRPEVADKIALVADLKEPKTISDSERKVEESRLKNNILFRPMVKSDNEKYDSEVKSYGLFADWSKKNKPENYASFVLEGDFDFKIEPYPIVKPPERRVLEEDKTSSLNGFLSSVKNAYDFFTFDGGLVDYYDDEEEFHDAKETFEKDDKSNKQKPDPKQQQSPEVRKAGETNKVTEYDVDWRDTGCVTKARAQESCNCCYAFTALGLMEYFYCMQKKKLTEFSAQYVVDCGTRVDLNGCRGGKMSGVGSFITKYGLELNTLYPYVGTENQCPYSDHEELAEKGAYLKPQIKAWQNFPTISAWSKWLKKSPIMVGINMPLDFLAYEGGIHDGLNCDQKMVHALLLVGSGTQYGKKFWLLKNSYSSDWGENGYFRLSKSAPVRCFNMATVVRAQFND